MDTIVHPSRNGSGYTPAMAPVHAMPTYPAGGTLTAVFMDRGVEPVPVALLMNDLSCGPLEPDDLGVRHNWLRQIVGDEVIGLDAPREDVVDGRFWWRVPADADDLIVWFSRADATDLAFVMAVSDRLGERPFRVIEVTDGRPVSALSPEEMARLLGTERTITAVEHVEMRTRWQQLKRENAAFRVLTPDGSTLASAPADQFDALLLANVGAEGSWAARVVAHAMAEAGTGDAVLFWRLAVLVEQGRLVADGDPRLGPTHIALR
ncbi:DUF3658 domain-containing protein [Nocardia sp. NPDC051030]|uniref:DUF3658 domain-containing protein n=1 Tax=Nocardia sp. NPDC051030 TaxID=3155162 RepID=UPI0034122F1A